MTEIDEATSERISRVAWDATNEGKTPGQIARAVLAASGWGEEVERLRAALRNIENKDYRPLSPTPPLYPEEIRFGPGDRDPTTAEIVAAANKILADIPNETLRAERDQARSVVQKQNDGIDELSRAHDVAEQRVATLEAALHKYGRHDQLCTSQNDGNSCGCGLDAALAPPAAPAPSDTAGEMSRQVTSEWLRRLPKRQPIAVCVEAGTPGKWAALGTEKDRADKAVQRVTVLEATLRLLVSDRHVHEAGCPCPWCNARRLLASTPPSLPKGSS